MKQRWDCVAKFGKKSGENQPLQLKVMLALADSDEGLLVLTCSDRAEFDKFVEGERYSMFFVPCAKLSDDNG